MALPRFTLRRRPLNVPVMDVERTRVWLMNAVHQEIRVKGQPHPRVILLFADHEETLDLNDMAKVDPGADGGATFQALRSRAAVRRFLLFQLSGLRTGTDEEVRMACLFEEIDTSVGRRWWCATCEFAMDRATQTGRTNGQWSVFPEVSDPAKLQPVILPFMSPPPGTRAALVDPPPEVVEPDIVMAFGEIPVGVKLPADAREFVQFAAELTVRDLLSGQTRGTVVVRLAGRAWEIFVADMETVPTSLDDFMRWIANEREPQADGVAVAQMAIRPQDDPPVPGFHVVGEFEGHFSEAWGPIVFTSGPAGPKEIPTVWWRDPKPVAETGQWLGIPASVQFFNSSKLPDA